MGITTPHNYHCGKLMNHDKSEIDSSRWAELVLIESEYKKLKIQYDKLVVKYNKLQKHNTQEWRIT